MDDPAVSCGGCGTPLARGALEGPGLVPCSTCGTRARAAIFPAFWNAQIHGDRPSLRGEEDASCFYHPDKRAHVPCDACGRFLCTLCDIELGIEHLCPACLEAGTRRGDETRLETERVLHDSVTLALAIVPMLSLWFITPITAPLVVYRSIRDFRKPSSLVRRSRWRLILAALVGMGQLLGWAAMVVALMA